MRWIVAGLILGVTVLAITVFAIALGPRSGKTFDGLVYVDYSHDRSRYEFFPHSQACPPQGTRYHLVPNDELTGQMTFLPGRFLQGAWRAKFKGDLSSIGTFGDSQRYWREVTVTDVYEVTEVPCEFK
ncbi:MAG TPA: hypothetical protein VEJ38_10040 [Candidatus Acidoferrales bacterium]|nr:hypothetical protein [Candidatus Acidoferrales bacterium]